MNRSNLVALPLVLAVLVFAFAQLAAAQVVQPNEIATMNLVGDQQIGFDSAVCDTTCETGTPVALSSEEPKFPSVGVTGFFQLDAGYYSQDAANKLTLGDIDDGLGFRRARLAAKGK